MARRDLRRWKIPISEIRRLAAYMCTPREAAGLLGVKVSTFEDMLKRDVNAAKAWEEGQSNFKVSLRRKQLRLADSSAPMAIFLGKMYLGQQDVTVTEVSGRDGGPIETTEVENLSADERKDLRALLLRATGKKASGAG